MLNITCEEMRSLCIKNQWFTCGSNEQYEKLFRSLLNGRPIEEIAAIIWVCSDECWRLDRIKSMLLDYAIGSIDGEPSDGGLACGDCPDDECTGHCMSCAYRA